MAEKIYRALPYAIIIILIMAIAALLMYILPYRFGLSGEEHFDMSDELIRNPLTGFAPPAQNIGQCRETSLVYIGLTWAEWEPEEDRYDIAALEEKYNIAEWKQSGKHAVLRFICDLPDDEEHIDIPEWLYEKTKDGAFYSNSYGCGYGPKYSNEYFMERHKKALAALAEYCNRDLFVSYVELGSLGHWGEWHVDKDAGIPLMPDEKICERYVLDYTESFTNVKFLMRRNSSIGVKHGLGIYTDMMGATDSTDLWLEWMRDGGSYSTENEPLRYTLVEKFWEAGPVGGELTSRYTLEELLGRRFIETLDTIKKTHATFIGPNSPVGELLKTDAADTILKNIGYRYYISEIKTSYSFREKALDVTLTWKSVGAAPLYWDWNVALHVFDLYDNQIQTVPLDLKLSCLVPGDEKEVKASVPFTEKMRKGYKIGVSVASPDGKEHITLAMDSEKKDGGVQLIYTRGK